MERSYQRDVVVNCRTISLTELQRVVMRLIVLNTLDD